MGTWSEHNFGNDDASDWIYELEASKGEEKLLAAIRVVNGSDAYLEAPDCCEALAASEVIAAALTGDYSAVPEEAKIWVNKKQGLIFGKKPNIQKSRALEAAKAVEKVMNDSELKELWEESEDFSKWQTVQQSLLGKLKGV